MNLKKALAGFLKEEPRRSGRLEALRFVRRYAHTTRPATHYRLQGPAVDAVPLLLRKAGLEDNKDFKVEKSAASDRTAKLWWLDGSRASEFISSCTAESYTGSSGLTLVEEAYCEAYAKASDEVILSKIRDANANADAEDATVTRTVDTGVTGLVSSRSKNIRTDIIRILGTDPEAACMSSENAKAFWPEILESCARGEEHDEFMPSLSVLEFYVRIILGKSFCRGASVPSDLIFAPVDDYHTVARPIVRGERVPVAHLMDAPLFETMEPEGGNPMDGYFSNTADVVLKSAEGRPGVLAVVNAPLACGNPAATNKVKAAEFAFVSRDLFWAYVRWVYAEAYHGLFVELTLHHTMGIHNESPAYGDLALSYTDEEPLHAHIARANTEMLTATAMLALVITKTEPVDRSCLRYENPSITVLRGTPETPSLGDNHIRESELVAEWFAMTHFGASVLPGKGRWYYYHHTDAERDEQLRAFRNFTSVLAATPKLVGAYCSVADNAYLHPSFENEVASFTPMSSLVSGAVGALKYWYGSTLDVPLAKWGAEDPRNCHTEGTLVTAVYSGMWGDASPSIDDDGRRSFPIVHGRELCEFVGMGLRQDERAAFTKFVDRISSRDFYDQVSSAPGSDKCSLVLETNVKADAFRNMAESDLENAKVLVRKLKYLFVNSLVFRGESPFEVLNGETVVIDTDRLGTIREELELDNVDMTDAIGENPSYGVADLADNYVSVTFHEDSFGRLYIVFTVTGDAVSLARLMFRGYCGIRVASEKDAVERWTRPDEARTVFVADEESYESACEVIRKATAALGGPTDFTRGRLAVAGMIRPLVSYRMRNVRFNEAPAREWFLSENGGDYIPSTDVRMS